MVHTDIAQLSRECNSWREALRSQKDDLGQMKDKLQQLVGQHLVKDALQDVEHYHNQFHIQLINIHDLKQAIKAHDRKVTLEQAVNDGQVKEETLADHENLFDQFQNLEQIIQDLKDEFARFLNQTQ